MQAFFQLDTERFKIKKELMSKFKDVKKHVDKYKEFHGIDKAVKGRNQFPENSFHTLMA